MTKKVIITDETERFTRSTCDCDFCKITHYSSVEWETFTPKTNLQKRMLKVVKRIEKRSRRRKTPY